MNLANFPMDDQLCTVEIESFGYTMADLRYHTTLQPGLYSVKNTVMVYFKLNSIDMALYFISM